ncbi:uncharacterized protein RJT20DRAFT_132703 [Scheffersomyces xylosifermentans]|uniref:uncharacterized protein n=1 Tax=Scheffersomyces xylosifermentans TaxID=1304137 RepID=UPI00315D7BA2
MSQQNIEKPVGTHSGASNSTTANAGIEEDSTVANYTPEELKQSRLAIASVLVNQEKILNTMLGYEDIPVKFGEEDDGSDLPCFPYNNKVLVKRVQVLRKYSDLLFTKGLSIEEEISIVRKILSFNLSTFKVFLIFFTSLGMSLLRVFNLFD